LDFRLPIVGVKIQELDSKCLIIWLPPQSKIRNLTPKIALSLFAFQQSKISNPKSKIPLSLSVPRQSKIANPKSKILLSLSVYPQSKISNPKSKIKKGGHRPPFCFVRCF